MATRYLTYPKELTVYDLIMPHIQLRAQTDLWLPRDEYQVTMDTLAAMGKVQATPNARGKWTYEKRDPSPVSVPLCVTSKSLPSFRNAVGHMARYLHRERDLDPWLWDPQAEEPDARGYLWTVDLHGTEKKITKSARAGLFAAVGGCCFRPRPEDPSKWLLTWVWFHPFFRRQGLLSAAWPYFRTRFPQFVVGPPYSREIVAFMEKKEAAGEYVMVP